MPRDFTKYQFNGQVYGKGRLVLAVVKDYVERKQPTLSQLQVAFPAEIQGRKGAFCTEADYKDKLKLSDDVMKRFFNKEDEKLTVDGHKLLVSTQWGDGNISKFIEHVKSLDIDIEVVSIKLTHDDVIQQFIHNNAFKQHYQNWSDDTLNSFCTLMLFANEMSLDIFTTKMKTGGAIRIGRKGHDHSTAQEVLATLEPKAETIVYQSGDYKVSLNSESLADISGSSVVQNFAQRLPITRGAYWPSDYVDTSSVENPRIWKVSHSPSTFKTEELDWLEQNQIITVHENTGNGSASAFKEISEGDVVSLSYGGKVYQVVRVTSDIQYFDGPYLDNAWMMRTYDVIKQLESPEQYKGNPKRWSPSFNGTSWEVPKKEYWMFEQEILKPYFKLTLKDLGFDTSQISNPKKTTMLMETMDKSPRNQILYGPPGTGKTYHTIQAAVKAAEPEMFSALGIDESSGTTLEQRAELTRLYKELYEAGRIRFVTFHQSYGYEEFVEGLKASSDDGNISYNVEDGVFKKICKQAQQGENQEHDQLEWAFSQFKIEIEEDGVSLKTERGKAFTVQYHGNKTFRVFPNATIHEDLGRGYPVSIENIRKLYRDANADGIYNSSYAKAILNHIKEVYKVPDYSEPNHEQEKNFVLIIDEINRGNISKIFGELITLIEPSKRFGKNNAEALTVTLPHSEEPFYVPDNLYLIGTMNTADRSLAMMDTALRRRFDFVEMMPKPILLSGKIINGIDLEQLLETMNKRIEVLYDREHTLGHAFFMSVTKVLDSKGEDEAFIELHQVFKNKIIPLLEEYFFEDWNKIRLVLGDNRKKKDTHASLIFVQEITVSYNEIFGEGHGLDTYDDKKATYKLTDFDDESGAWHQALAYQAIYDSLVLKKQNKSANSDNEQDLTEQIVTEKEPETSVL
ncbi:McrB family protein [Thalassotalea marina]|uniref:ATPase dynein-related AAA domain-containing protein n=1 Tax=Thalassotalea marina TaxID=1673741 RepID=A0A919BL16_9GAMM|nr:AAA family ATPase [Thalassotalea marina]GHF97404.1 hypothetical protein GCM10017161_26970 [Thalassotalea marina]